jgi:hypothetical protein
MLVIPADHTMPAENHVLTPKQRKLLMSLLNRDLNKCSTSGLAAAQRLGWTLGPAGHYELTHEGRRLAELCETTPVDQTVPLN